MILRNKRLQLLLMGGSQLIILPVQKMAQRIDERMEGGILMVRRTPTLEAKRMIRYMRFCRQDKTRLTNACFSTQHDHVPIALLYLSPALQQHAKFEFTSDKRYEFAGVSNIKPVLGATRLQGLI